LEVVRDELLRAFAEIPGLQPEDVLVAVSDFDTYAPLAEGILLGGVTELPVRLTAIPAREANPVAVALLALLRLALGRAAASEVIELLNLAAIQQHLELAGEAERLAGLADAIRRSGLTHGLEAAGAEAIGTWRAALDRHLAGAWFGPETAARDAAGALVHPVAAELHQHDAEIARFAAWLTELAMMLETWRGPAPAKDWSARLTAGIDTLLYSEALDDHAAALRRLGADEPHFTTACYLCARSDKERRERESASDSRKTTRATDGLARFRFR
jgi:exodeoxyribonuclease V gamma subunit